MFDPHRAARAATSVVFPIGIWLLIGVPAALSNLIAVLWFARSWIGALVALAFVIAWFVLGFQYGLARAVR